MPKKEKKEKTEKKPLQTKDNKNLMKENVFIFLQWIIFKVNVIKSQKA